MLSLSYSHILLDELSRPSNVSLVGATPNYLTFKWGSVTHSCSTLLYNITMTGPNCGTCPSIVSSTTTNCSIEPLQPGEVRVCTFRVQGVLCGNVSGPSNEINVTLQGILNTGPGYNALASEL